MWSCKLVLLLCLLANLALATLPYGGKKWALLVAGSSGYYNYRHQADICRAYQILHANGIPDENIIVMMVDDIAQSKENPTPGMLINEPNGTDVYAGVPKDYVGNAVNASIFLAVLRGDKDAVKGIGSERVIESGPYDHVFVNFADHGAPGLLAMPSDMVYASQLLSTLLEMSAASRFSKLVMYIEACESGSMFDTILPDDTNIFAVTAADPRESSYACYYDEARSTYLGDLFSVMWMQDAEQEDLSRTTLHHQFEIVRSRTNMSHVEEYGDLNIGSSLLQSFIGLNPSTANVNKVNVPSRRHPGLDVVSSRDVPLVLLEKKIKNETDKKKQKVLKAKWHNLKKKRSSIEKLFKSIVHQVTDSKDEAVGILNQRQRISDLTCYEQAVRAFDSKCTNLAKNTHGLSQLYLFVNLCENGYSAKSITDAIDVVCSINETNSSNMNQL